MLAQPEIVALHQFIQMFNKIEQIMAVVVHTSAYARALGVG